MHRALWLCVVAALSACSGGPPLAAFEGRTMGTTWSVKVIATQSIGGVGATIQRELDAVNAEMSTYLPTSELSQFNASRSTDWFPVSPAVAHVVAKAIEIGRQSDGALDVTVGPLVNLWGFGPGKRRTAPPADAEVGAARMHCGLNKLECRREPPALRKHDPALYVDLSSIAKGHGVDRVARLLVARGFTDYFIEVGGEVRAAGRKGAAGPWHVALERPSPGERRLSRRLALHDAAIATSGDYRNFFTAAGRRYSHTIDPRTGRPIAHALVSVSVVAATCETADAWATALLVLGPEKAYDSALEHGFAACLVARTTKSFVTRTTPAFDRLAAEH